MLKIEEYVCNLKESNTLFNDIHRIDTLQSSESYDNTQFQNPIYNIVPPEYFQSVQIYFFVILIIFTLIIQIHLQ